MDGARPVAERLLLLEEQTGLLREDVQLILSELRKLQGLLNQRAARAEAGKLSATKKKPDAKGSAD